MLQIEKNIFAIRINKQFSFFNEQKNMNMHFTKCNFHTATACAR